MTGESSAFRFTAPGRHIVDENRIELTSVGVDIGSSTSHLVFSHLELERQGNRYVTVNRTILYESDILLTPYTAGTNIDGTALGRFVAQQYEAAGLRREDVDTGALILTGVAVYRENARAIADLFAQEAGRFVAVSAGDGLEATMAAYGSGAVDISSRARQTVMNVDVGGGTTKVAICRGGELLETAAIEVGARLLVLSEEDIITRLEGAGRRIGAAIGLDLRPGHRLAREALLPMARYMAERLMELVELRSLSALSRDLMRTDPLRYRGKLDAITFSGGVSEFIYGRETKSFGDLGPLLAEEIKARVSVLGIPVLEPIARIRATVIGASQYTVQVSGNTIFLSALDIVPIRNVPVITPAFPLTDDDIHPPAVQGAVRTALSRLDLLSSDLPVALALRWEGSATYGRIHALCQGIVEAMAENLAGGNPLVLVCNGDVGGLLGIHLKEEMRIRVPVISIDGVELREFDYIDIGTLIPASGAVPVVIKSLVFPTVNQARVS